MKKTFLIALLFNLIIVNVYQVTSIYGNNRNKGFSIGDFKYGVKIGPSFFRYDNEKGNNYVDATVHTNIRFHGGIFCEYILTETKTLCLEASYIGKGTKFLFKKGLRLITGEEVKHAKINLDYLMLSMGLSSYPGDDKNFFVLVSLYTAYMLSAKSYLTHEASSGEKIYTKIDLMKDRDDLQKVDMGITLGGGYEFDRGLILRLTSDIGFRSIYKSFSTINFGWNFSVGHNFAKLFKTS